MVTISTGQVTLRAENIDRAVKGFALQQYKFKQLLLVQPSSSWKETYYVESATELTAGGTRNIKGVSRLANFPYVEPNWSQTSARHQKYAAEGVVSWEDAKTNEIDVLARTLLRITRAITKAVDDEIYAQLIAATGIGTAAASDTWDSLTVANRNPIQDILRGIQNIAESNYDVLENGYLLLNPHDYASLMINSKVINNPSFKTADVVSNGRVGQVCGLTIIVSNSVPDDEALIIKGQTAATWKTALALTTETIVDPLIKYTIRAAEIGITMVTNPAAIYRITTTQV